MINACATTTSAPPASRRSTCCARSTARSCPYAGGLEAGFAFRGRRVPFLNYQKGIYRAAVQRGPAALSVNTSFESPYGDAERPTASSTPTGPGDVDQPDNRALRAAYETQAPLVCFVGTRPGAYRPEWPIFVTRDGPISRMVTLTPGRMIGAIRRARARPSRRRDRASLRRPGDARPAPPGPLRGRVLPAYANQCAICRLKESRLLDAAHIVADFGARRRADGLRTG